MIVVVNGMDEHDGKPKDTRSLKEKLFPLRPLWKNFLFSDWKMAFIFFWTIFMVFAYLHDTGQFRDAALHPCDYCPLGKPLYTIDGGGTSWNNLTGMSLLVNGSAVKQNLTS